MDNTVVGRQTGMTGKRWVAWDSIAKKSTLAVHGLKCFANELVDLGERLPSLQKVDKTALLNAIKTTCEASLSVAMTEWSLDML